ncbi:GAF domain-containing protein [Chromobacterium piscinae]|uniref:GAF domain-containing protein n=1 Tax=Chromobacterium piscinae TaxID=686831 RepID=UPI001E4F7547|nr:GAF domain-containing protein [Chromobacterium piscinae]MCD5328242.1 GAF domain-containing protein [Chromobacterium piscinae]
MHPPGIPTNEAERIRVLQELLILDTDPEERYDAITAYCRSRFAVKIALISLVDSNRQWFKSHSGLDTSETSRDISFCGHAILGDDILEIPNACDDCRFADNPLVTGDPNIRFYAGAPLQLSSGHTIGTLCLIDSKPKRLAGEEKRHLKTLAHTVVLEIEGSRAVSEPG